MRIYLRFFFLFAVILIAVPCLAKSWNNIFPLQTTRAGVLNLLGEPLYDEDGKEYFTFHNQKIKIYWTRPDCYGERLIIEDKNLINSESLVYQITVVPNEPLESIELYNPPEVKKKEIGEEIKDWVSMDVNCFGNIESGMNCNVSDGKKGFGYSLSKGSYTALYFFPTTEEKEVWKEKLNPCSSSEN